MDEIAELIVSEATKSSLIVLLQIGVYDLIEFLGNSTQITVGRVTSRHRQTTLYWTRLPERLALLVVQCAPRIDRRLHALARFHCGQAFVILNQLR